MSERAHEICPQGGQAAAFFLWEIAHVNFDWVTQKDRQALDLDDDRRDSPVGLGRRCVSKA
jgi:hypothetical protein